MRRRRADKRELAPDVRYNSELVAKLINTIMERGKKSTAQAIVYGAFDMVRQKVKNDPLEVFLQALDNIKPQLEVKSRRVGGANYQVPVEVRPARRQSLSSRWIIEFARKRTEKSMKERLAGEMMDAFQMRGGAIKRREDVHRMAEANKAFSHFRF